MLCPVASEGQNLDSLEMDSTIRANMELYDLPGLALMITSQEWVFWEGYYGHQNLEDSIPVTDSTIFLIGSGAKAVTAVAVMQLHEEGYFDLDDDINDYLADYVDFEIRNPHYPDWEITFTMLLNYTSSLLGHGSNWPEDIFEDVSIGLDSLVEQTFVPGGVYYSESIFGNYLPGTGFRYTGAGYTILAFFVELFSGQDFLTYCQENVFGPLNMPNTSFMLSDLDTNRVARPYRKVDGESVYLGHFCPHDYPSIGLRTSARDYSHLLMALANDGWYNFYQLLHYQSLDLMYTIHNPQDAPEVGLCFFDFDYPGSWYLESLVTGLYMYVAFNTYSTNTYIMFCNTKSVYDAPWDILWAMVAYRESIVDIKSKPRIPERFILRQNYPNPFNRATALEYSIPFDHFVEMSIYNCSGDHIRTLIESFKPAGEYVIHWDGLDLSGETVSSGIYFASLTIDGYSQTIKMTNLK